MFRLSSNFERRSRAGVHVFLVLLFFVTVGLLVAFLSGCSNNPDTSAQADTSTQPGTSTQPDTSTQEVVAPSDPTLYLTVPRLGIYNNTVRNDVSESALSIGAIKLPGTDFPWQQGDKNTYIACHRLGYPNTESYHQCLNLPMLQKGDQITLEDANGEVYEYRVSKFLQVGPTDLWVTERSKGRQIVSLQTCIENYNDFYTLGPNWRVRYIVQADQVS